MLMCCGRRILVFLANTMPLEERSGVNLQGSFNTAHSTPVEDVPEVGCSWLRCKGQHVPAAGSKLGTPGAKVQTSRVIGSHSC